MHHFFNSKELKSTESPGLGNANVIFQAVVASFLFFNAAAAWSANREAVNFDDSLLFDVKPGQIDLSRYAHKNPILAGEFFLKLFVNEAYVGRYKTRFQNDGNAEDAVLCVNKNLLNALNVDTDLAWLKDALSEKGCQSLGALLPSASAIYDDTEGTILFQIPQAYLRKAGQVNPEMWDRGIDAFRLNYNANAFEYTQNGNSFKSAYVGAEAGFNYGDWRFRDTFNASRGGGASTKWQNIEMHAQRHISGWKSQLTIGNANTDGDLFKGFGFQGVSLKSDDRMLPRSQLGYTPTVTGIASTNAKVSIRQNGILIYQAVVPPGPFSINDFVPLGVGGDLQVTVLESNGDTKSFSVPYSSVVQLLKAGSTRFEFVAGRLSNVNGLSSQRPIVTEGTFRLGMTDFVTGYAGVLASEKYLATLVGGAINSPFGGISLDTTLSRANLGQLGDKSGASTRAMFSKLISPLDTRLALSAYRYSTSGYYDLLDAQRQRELLTQGNATALPRPKQRFDLLLSQPLPGNWGSLDISAQTNKYAGGSGDRSYQVAWQKPIDRMNMRLELSRSKNARQIEQNQVNFSLTIPLGSKVTSGQLYMSAQRTGEDSTLVSSTYSGAVDPQGLMSYAVTASDDLRSATKSEGANLTYRGSKGQVGGSISHQAGGGNQFSVQGSGSLLIFKDGFVLGQSLGETIGLVRAGDAAEGAHVTSSSGSRIDGRGYAIVPYLSAYMDNVVQLDPKGLPLNVSLDGAGTHVIPTAGAIVEMKFESSRTHTLFANIETENGAAPPFGSRVLNESGDEVATVGAEGTLIVGDLAQSGRLLIEWKDKNAQGRTCVLPYDIADGDGAGRAAAVELKCSVE